jgi:hypothetical protein
VNIKKLKLAHDNMDLRDKLACHAINGILSTMPSDEFEESGFGEFLEWAPRSAYMLADAMLEARGKTLEEL